jgi:hypothetical protein
MATICSALGNAAEVSAVIGSLLLLWVGGAAGSLAVQALRASSMQQPTVILYSKYMQQLGYRVTSIKFFLTF